jgi:hypothetical protein
MSYRNICDGQSAGKESKSDVTKVTMIGHDSPSTTVRLPVYNEGLINRNRHKIQSGDIGNYIDKPS